MNGFARSLLLALTLAAGPMASAQTFEQSLAALERRDYRAALAGFRKLAEQGHAGAQKQLGAMYSNGEGVPNNTQMSMSWYRNAAEQGDADSQMLLGLKYVVGDVVPKDELLAYFWFLLSSAQGDETAKLLRDQVERELTREQRASAQAAARNWRPKTTAQSGATPGPDRGDTGGLTPAPRRNPAASADEPDSTGSGFRVAHGTVVTNYHVVDGCGRLRVNGVLSRVSGSDANRDLALLDASETGPATTLRAQPAAVGEPVAVAGFPLRGLLSGFNMTTGTLSSLSGIGGDTRYLQITAPVQPGNSGGPMLDSAGNLMGVVVSKLDAIKTARITGDIPQNVNFAINTNVLRSFLDANGVDYVVAASDRALPPTVIADKAKGFTVLVECWK